LEDDENFRLGLGLGLRLGLERCQVAFTGHGLQRKARVMLE